MNVSRVVRGAHGRTSSLRAATLARLLIAGVSLCAFTASGLSAQNAERGRAVYDRWCAGCHGDSGAGDGDAAAFMLPRPRDFTGAVYQIRTTGSGDLPTDADLRHVIDRGMPGTAMPGWESRLTAQERDDVIAYLKTFSRFFDGASPEPLTFGGAPRVTDEGLAEGAQIYRELECFKCHGDAGRGDGPSAPTMTDDWDFPIRPTDLTRPWAFNGGPSVEQIYRRLRTGLDGTPMPSFSDVIDAEIITEDQLWRVAQYVASLAPDRPRVREVVRTARVDAVPSGPEDSGWAAADPSYIPLVGQIVVSPRWFTPTIDGLWVRALHDGSRLALRLTWSDPSASPDSVWQDWLDLIARTVQDHDGVLDPVQRPDRVTVQFPEGPVDGMERPYFLGGDPRHPVRLWRWSSNPSGVDIAIGTGPGQARPVQGTIDHTATFADGQWQLQLTRDLAPADSGGPVFREGMTIPIAFRAADGSSGEDELRGAVSAWYALYLDVPTPPGVFVTPVVTALLTAGLGLFVIMRAQRRDHNA